MDCPPNRLEGFEPRAQLRLSATIVNADVDDWGGFVQIDPAYAKELPTSERLKNALSQSNLELVHEILSTEVQYIGSKDRVYLIVKETETISESELITRIREIYTKEHPELPRLRSTLEQLTACPLYIHPYLEEGQKFYDKLRLMQSLAVRLNDLVSAQRAFSLFDPTRKEMSKIEDQLKADEILWKNYSYNLDLFVTESNNPKAPNLSNVQSVFIRATYPWNKKELVDMQSLLEMLKSKLTVVKPGLFFFESYNKKLTSAELCTLFNEYLDKITNMPALSSGIRSVELISTTRGISFDSLFNLHSQRLTFKSLLDITSNPTQSFISNNDFSRYSKFLDQAIKALQLLNLLKLVSEQYFSEKQDDIGLLVRLLERSKVSVTLEERPEIEKRLSKTDLTMILKDIHTIRDNMGPSLEEKFEDLTLRHFAKEGVEMKELGIETKKSKIAEIHKHLNILQLPVNPYPTKEQVIASWKKLSMQWHPDKNKSEGAEEKFKAVTKAKEEVLEFLKELKS